MPAQRKPIKPRKVGTRAVGKMKQSWGLKDDGDEQKSTFLTNGNGSASVALYSSLEALYNGQVRTGLLGNQYTRGLPGRQSIDRFEQAKFLVESQQNTASPTPTYGGTDTQHEADQKNSAPASTPDSSRTRRVLRRRRAPEGKNAALPTKAFLPISSRVLDSHLPLSSQPRTAGHIQKVQIGPYLIDVWYLAPYPEEYSQLEVLYIKCPMKHPPGDEIYRDGILSIFEVDGRKNKRQMTEDVTLSYPTTHTLEDLILFLGYLLSQKEGKAGSPEKPLSDLGLLSYRKYWINTINKQLQDWEGSLTVAELSRRTCITIDDVISTLDLNGMLIQNPDTGAYIIMVKVDTEDQAPKPKRLVAKSEFLTWVPYMVAAKGDAGILNVPRETPAAPNAVSLALTSISTAYSARDQPRPTTKRIIDATKRRTHPKNIG
ncbi:hypothetical protein DFQ29_010203 [Apophysomyces sp. BC1021]|nr:hypothetical protein DFQ29_010203 [Apophysomyces sp. BC1021]